MNKGLIAVVVVFLGFWLLNDAAGFAGAAEGAVGAVWGLTKDLFNGLIDFFDAL